MTFTADMQKGEKMSDPIERQDVLNLLDSVYQYMGNWLVQYIEDGISSIPPVQPEIIQCKDCKYWREGVAYSYCDKLFNMGVLDVYDYMVSDDDFCSKAERREE